MIAVNDHSTIGETFFRAADAYADKSFLAVPANPARAYDPAGKEITYAEAASTVRELMQAYSVAGYGVGHRIALLIENRPEHMLHKLAMNALGVCCVPLNPDHRLYFGRHHAIFDDHLEFLPALTCRDALRC